jgi:ATP-dependent RNA helicase SUPV3L1/SUV3
MNESPMTLFADPQMFFEGLQENLEISRKAFVTTSLAGDANQIRSIPDAQIVLETLKAIYQETSQLLSQIPSLESIYEKNFGILRELTDRESLLEISLLDEYLFPRTEQWPLTVGGEFNAELVTSYRESFQEWCKEKAEFHNKAQELIKTQFDFKLSPGDLKCQCTQCLADYRTKLREEVMEQQEKLIDQAEDRLFEMILSRSITDVSNYVYNLRKNMERGIHQVRSKFKRSSLNKIESEVKLLFRSKFSPQSALGKVYKEKLMAFFNSCLVEQGLKPEMISAGEYERFFLQQETGIWKPEGFLRKEFEKFTRSVMLLKRKDISSTILRDYLGQFWVHAEARKLNRKIIYHMGPTNSGKTYHAIEALVKAEKGCYLAPLRLLAAELFDTMNQKGATTTLLTGEEVIEIPGSTHFSSTIEMARLNERFDCAVIDEIQMLADSQRGWAWTRALVNLQADEVHLCGDASVLELVKQILKLTGDTLEVKEYTRMTELKVMDDTLKLTDLEKGDALIVFSRRNALKFKADLENLDFKVSIVYGRLSPEVRREQARKFDFGETDIIVSTDAIAMGMNLPVQRIVFSALSKFIDNKEIPLSMSEIKQIAGRAGRFGRFPIGYTTTLNRVDAGLERLHEALEYKLEQSAKAMVGPDLEIYKSVNSALEINSLPVLSLSEFLRLFNTMLFEKPFYCTDLKEMIEIAEMVEQTDENNNLLPTEIFGFACAPVNLGLVEHVQYFLWMLKHYVDSAPIQNESIDHQADDIDYLETSIKCVELYQWLARHFDGKNFEFVEQQLLENKAKAVERLNTLLSEKTTKTCSSCGCKLSMSSRFAICDNCFNSRKNSRRNFRPPSEQSAPVSKKPSSEGASPRLDLSELRNKRQKPSGFRPKGRGKNAAAAFTGVGGGPTGGKSKKNKQSGSKK